MSDDKKVRLPLTDEDMVTSPRLSRRTLLAGVGIALSSRKGCWSGGTGQTISKSF